MPLGEASAGVLLGWLWKKLEDYAEKIGKASEVKKALRQAINDGHVKFSQHYPELENSFFDPHFLKHGIGQEFEKLLTRDESPNVQEIAAAYHAQFGKPVDIDIEPILSEFFDLVEKELGRAPILRDAMDSRMLEKIHQKTDSVQRTLGNHTQGHEQTHALLREVLDCLDKRDRQEAVIQDYAVSGTNATTEASSYSALESIPSNTEDSLVNSLINKQVELAKGYISEGKLSQAESLLEEIRDEVAQSDELSRFRWLTCLSATYLMKGDHQRAADGYIEAFDLAPHEEKAWANKARAFLITEDPVTAITLGREGLANFPESALIWSVIIIAEHSLGEEQELEHLPESVADDPGVLFAMSFVHAGKEKYQEAFLSLKRVVQTEKRGIEVKQALLQNALSYALEDGLPPYHADLGSDQVEALEYSLSAVGSIENILENADRTPLVDALVNNVAVAYELSGKHERATMVAELAVEKGMVGDGIFRIIIEKNLRTRDLTSVKSLCESRIPDFSNERLLFLLEIASSFKSIEFGSELIGELEIRDLNEAIRSDYLTLRVLFEWRCYGAGPAEELGKVYLKDQDENLLLIVLIARIRAEANQDLSDLISRAIDLANSSSVSGRLQVAEFLYDIGHWAEASKMYRSVIERPRSDSLGQRYLRCLIESDQRGLARKYLNELPQSDRSIPQIQRIEANLARAVGDMDLLEKLLTAAVSDNPDDSYLTVSLAGCLLLKDDTENLNEILSSDPRFKNAPPEHEFEFAKYQARSGFPLLALGRMYSLFKARPNDSAVAGYYLIILLLIGDSELELTPCESGEGVATLINDGESERWVVVDLPGFESPGQWPEITDVNSPIGQDIRSKRVGDVIRFDNGISESEVVVRKREHIYLFVARKAREVVEKSVTSSGPLWSVKLINANGEVNLEPLLQSAAARRKHLDRIFGQYASGNIPVASIASTVGADQVNLSLDWPFKEVKKYVSNGNREVRESLCKIARNETAKSFVAELQVLVEIAIYDLWDNVHEQLGTLLVPNSLVEQLIHILETEKGSAASVGTMVEIEGQMRFTEVSKESIETRFNFIKNLLAKVREKCEILPAFGPDEVGDHLSFMREVTDDASADAILLALEREALLLSDDNPFSLFAKHFGVEAYTDFQSLLSVMIENGILRKEDYSRIILDKINRGHTFISVDAKDLFWAAKKNRTVISASIRAVLKEFENDNLEVGSGIRVCLGFLNPILEKVPPHVFKQYYQLCKRSLSENREELVDYIHEAFRRHTEAAMMRLKARDRRTLTRILGSHLTPIALPDSRKLPPRNRLSHAIYRISRSL